MKTSNLYGKVVRCTELAFCFQPDGEDAVWIPFSQLQDPDEKYVRECVGQEIDIEIPAWLAAEHDL